MVKLSTESIPGSRKKKFKKVNTKPAKNLKKQSPHREKGYNIRQILFG